jgi:hypothetical protein
MLIVQDSGSNNINASISKNGIYIMDVKLPIEENDTLREILPNADFFRAWFI